MNLIIIALPIITLAFLGESIFGFGGGLISIPLLSIFLDVKDSVTLILIFQFFMGLLIIGSYKHIAWKTLLPMTITLVFGTILGTYLLSTVSDSFLRIFFAFTIFAFLLRMLFFNGLEFIKKKMKTWSAISGFLGGLLQGIIGISGPLLTMYLLVALPKKSEFRAALIYLFFITSIIRVIISYTEGLFNQTVTTLALTIIPFFLLAIYAGHHIHKRIDEKYYRIAVYIILFVSAVLMLIKH
jgi:uncharacterized protein